MQCSVRRFRTHAVQWENAESDVTMKEREKKREKESNKNRNTFFVDSLHQKQVKTSGLGSGATAGFSNVELRPQNFCRGFAAATAFVSSFFFSLLEASIGAIADEIALWDFIWVLFCVLFNEDGALLRLIENKRKNKI